MAFEEKAIRCTECGSPVSNLNPRAQTAVCKNCGAQLDLTSPDYKVLGHFRKQQLKLPVEVGWIGRYEGEEIRIVGHIRYSADGYKWDEFMMLTEGGRTLWLQVDEGKPALLETITPLEVIVPEEIGNSVTINGRNSRVNERGFARIIRIDGELSWKAKKDDSVGYIDTQHYSVEFMQNEIEIYEKIPVTWDQIKQIFGKLNSLGSGSPASSSGGGRAVAGQSKPMSTCGVIFIIVVFLIILSVMSMFDSCSGGGYSGGRSSYSSRFGGK